MLTSRKLKQDESTQEYFLIMRELATRGNTNTKALIQYVTEGIPDNISKKVVLYGTTSKSRLQLTCSYAINNNHLCRQLVRKRGEVYAEIADM
ncbi:hypothetical protein RN001_010174 [Aquatica leii]|uniref:Uncharacterized protein n=1 Tax=Aquatica leii TaxID=1421715 RepID=A0AAN7QHA7_9COLE|nr:hypothetical protein RN001_010174 [Aquatica leii]